MRRLFVQVRIIQHVYVNDMHVHKKYKFNEKSKSNLIRFYVWLVDQWILNLSSTFTLIGYPNKFAEPEDWMRWIISFRRVLSG